MKLIPYCKIFDGHINNSEITFAVNMDGFEAYIVVVTTLWTFIMCRNAIDILNDAYDILHLISYRAREVSFIRMDIVS